MLRKPSRPIETACLLMMVSLIAPSAVAATALETDSIIDELLSDADATSERQKRDSALYRTFESSLGSSNYFVEGEYKPTLSSIGSEGGFENAPNGIPQDVWEIIEEQTGLPDFGSVLDGNITIEDVWDIVDSQYDLPDYESIFGSNDTFGGGYESAIIKNFAGNSVIPASQSPGGRPTIPLPPGGGGNTPTGSPIPHGTPLPKPGGSQPSVRPPKGKSGYNPFRRVFEWIKGRVVDPVVQAFGRPGQGNRKKFTGNALGILTRNSVVKSRDQANLVDQEMARLLAEPRLGEAGEEWIEEEAKASDNVLGIGLEESNLAVELAAKSQDLTSTQDVAKSVAKIGGHNAQLGASNLMLQAQNQASLLQLQQLMSANIKLGANISEGIDEINRRERLERSRAFSDSAGETLFLPGVFSKE